MKKVFCFILTTVMIMSFAACGSSQANTSSSSLSLGDTVSTDILEFTLDEAQLAIALSSVYNDTYFAPKEYNASEDTKNPLVCSKGQTYAAFTYTLTNLDRANFNGKLPLVSAEYKGTTSNKQVDGAEYNKASGEWEATGNNPVSPVYSWHFVLDVGEDRTYRSYIDIPVEVDDLSDEFNLIVELPKSDGTTEAFTYTVK